MITATKKARIGRAERSRPSKIEIDPVEWELRDWYADSCSCGVVPGKCHIHHRARDNQRPPDGDWRTLVWLAGRAFGKTRVGAEWVRWMVEENRARRIALVAPTAADVRHVMVEGESGLLSVCPSWDWPIYNPSIRQLKWRNGAIATMYSAEEPNRLRGPQHDAAWCLAGDTLVTMADGTQQPISSVRKGDMVATRLGPRMVTASALMQENAEVFQVDTLDGRTIIGTGDHKVYVIDHGFVPIASLVQGMEVCAISALSGTDVRGTDTAIAITSEHTRKMVSGPDCTSTARCGSTLTGRSRTATKSTTGTATSATIASAILSCCSRPNIRGCITRRSLEQDSGATRRLRRRFPLLRRPERNAENENSFVPNAAPFIGAGLLGTRQNTALWIVLRGLGLAFSWAKFGLAIIAEKATKLLGESRSIAPGGAISPRRFSEHRLSLQGTSPALLAGTSFAAREPMLGSVPGLAPSLSTRTIVSARRLARRFDVYDISVDEAREFFANGILVHNCDELCAWQAPQTWDMLMFGLRLGKNPRVVVTTTPRPTELLKGMLGEVTTRSIRGSTHDNRDHLAPTFFDKIIAKYEGTRLGQQEIYAEIIDISEAAWFASFDAVGGKHVNESAEYDYRYPVHLAIDCGVSQHVGAVWFQVRPLDSYRSRVTVFGDYHAQGKYSEANAKAIRVKGLEELPCRGRLDTVRVDPAANAKTGIGPAAYEEFERVFGPRLLSRWPSHGVCDGLDQLELLLESGCLVIHPRCAAMKAAFQNYARKQTRSGDFLDEPVDPQHPHEDMMDALRGGVRDRFPEGRTPPPNLRRTAAGRAV